MPYFNKSIAMILVVFGMMACQQEQASAPQPMQMPPPSVDIAEVQEQDIAIRHEYFGRTTGFQEVEIHARVEGILIERNYTEGERVEKGDLLFRIDPNTYEVAVDRAKAQLQQEKARLKDAQRTWNRISKLYEEKTVSESERDNAEYALESSQAGIALAEAELRSAKINLGYTNVKAPISGITSRRVMSEGSLVTPGMASSLLTRITRTDPIYVIFSYPDSDYIEQQRLIEQGVLKKTENAQLQAEIIFPDGSVYEQPGYVDFTETFIDGNTGTVEARAVFPNPSRNILPGQFVRIRLSGLVQTKALLIPPQCVMQDPQGQLVYRLDDQDVAHVVRVETEVVTEEVWMVKQGLSAGDRVISNGLLHVIPEQSVTVDQIIQPKTESIAYSDDKDVQ